MDEIRLLVLGDELSLADSLAAILPRRGHVAVRGPVGLGEAIEAFEAGEADLAVIDVDRPGGDAIRWIELLRSGSEGSRVLGVSEEESPDVLVGALVAGACGVVPRRTSTEELLRMLHRAVAGELVIPDRDLHRVVGRLRRGVAADVTDETRLASLTGRETEVLSALAEGLSTGEMAKRFGISVMTVQSHVKSILSKLAVHSKVEAVTFAWRTGVSVATRTA